MKSCSVLTQDDIFVQGFTLIELLVVIAIIAVLAIVVVLTLNPAQLLMQSRDSNRLSDITSISSALGYYRTDVPSGSLGTASTTYISVPDPAATSTNACPSLGMPSSSVAWLCTASNTYRQVSGSGWVPVNLSQISFGSPLGQLPIDPTNQTSSNLYYTYQTNGSQYEVTAVLESTKYKAQLASSPQIPSYPEVAAQGTNLTLSSLWNSSGLVGYWPLDEGSGTVANDLSGNNNVGTWVGGSVFTSGKVGISAGSFNGSTNYIGAPSTNSLSASNTITMAAWVNLASYTAGGSTHDRGAIIDKASAYYMTVASPTGTLDVYLSGATAAHTPSNSVLPLNSWVHCVITYDLSNIRWYINGVLDKTFSAPGTAGFSATALGLGAENTNYRMLNGQLDDLRVYNRALSTAEVQALYNAEK